MYNKDTTKTAVKSRTELKMPPERKRIDHLFQKNGYFDGKLFHSKDKATYTFIFENEVVSLHCDVTKHAIFLKGHKITGMNCHPHLARFLTLFKKALVTNPETIGFVKHFDAILDTLSKAM